MTIPQMVYLAAVAVYLVFFFLFLRFFYWKAYADLNFWRKKPYLDIPLVRQMALKKGRSVPFFSVVIPARNESDIIEKTVHHMLSLNYPPERYEVVVVTDEKEARLWEKSVGGWAEEAAGFIKEHRPQTTLLPQARAMVLGLFTEICLHMHSPELSEDAALRQVVFEIAQTLILSTRAKQRSGLSRVYRRAQQNGFAHPQPMCTDLAVLVAGAYLGRLAGSPQAYLGLFRYHSTPAEFVRSSGAISSHAYGMDEKRLEQSLGKMALEFLPTTQHIVDSHVRSQKTTDHAPRLKHVVVPYDFDGKYKGSLVGWAVASTKGRALNYALSLLDTKSEMCAFYDAESRPDPDAILYAGYRRIADGKKAALFQGPVFQVRNFYTMGPFCKIASLYQAIAHDWYLPALFRRLPFVGGTNLVIATDLLKDIGGFDYTVLTEDLELGARAYLLKGAWPEYLPYYSSEQTPQTFYAFFRQRLRWGTGHLQVMDKIKAENRYPAARKRPLLKQLYLKGQFEWAIYQAATFVPPLVLVLWWRGMVDPHILPESVRWVLNGFSGTYVAFTIYAYYRYIPYVDTWARPKTVLGRAFVVVQLFFLPMAAFFFPVPYSSAMVLKAINKEPKNWVKTPRTKE